MRRRPSGRGGRASSPRRPTGGRSPPRTASSRRAPRGEAGRAPFPRGETPCGGRAPRRGPPTPRAIPARAIAAVARPKASLEKAAPRAARRAARSSRADRSFAHTSLPTACGRPTRTRSAHTSPHEKRGPVGKRRSSAGAPVRGEGAERERKSHGEKARHHEAELEEVRPDDGALAAERRVRDEEGRRDDEDAHGLPRRRRDDDGLGRLGQEREPDDLREDDEKGGDLAHAGPYVLPTTSASVVAPVARTRGAKKRPRARRPSAPARSSQSAGRPTAATSAARTSVVDPPITVEERAAQVVNAPRPRSATRNASLEREASRAEKRPTRRTAAP